MPVARGVVSFWFEFASTYSYLAAMRIEDLARRAEVAFEWRPFLLGPIFARQGWSDSPFNLNPVRGRYMWHDIERQCRRHGLPFRRPSRFPRNSVLAARVACLGAGRPWLPAFVKGTFVANFGEDRDIGDPGVVEALVAAAGEDGPGLVAEATSAGNKMRLRAETERAWEIGVFGAPTCIVDGEPFWGNDRLEEAFEWARAAAPAESR